MTWLETYHQHVEERAKLGIPPLPLNAKQTSHLCEMLQNPPEELKEELMMLLCDRIPPGVDEASYVKAGFLTAVAKGELTSPIISKQGAVSLLGTMMGGYNVQSLVSLLKSADNTVASEAANALSKTLLVFDAFNDVLELSENNSYAKQVIDAWAEASWFISKPKVAESITVTVFKVPGETNTDDLSPAPHATTRPDIPLHALAMLESRMPEGLETIAKLKQKGHPVAYVGDVVGTGSSRKSAINSVLWHLGEEIPFVPNKKSGGYVLGGKIAPIFFNTAEDSGALPIECDVTNLNTGDVITIYPYEGKITNENGDTITTFTLKPETILDEVRAGDAFPF